MPLYKLESPPSFNASSSACAKEGTRFFEVMMRVVSTCGVGWGGVDGCGCAMVHTYALTDMYMHTHMCVPDPIYRNMGTYTQTHVHAYTCIHSCIHTRMHVGTCRHRPTSSGTVSGRCTTSDRYPTRRLAFKEKGPPVRSLVMPCLHESVCGRVGKAATHVPSLFPPSAQHTYTLPHPAPWPLLFTHPHVHRQISTHTCPHIRVRTRMVE